ncbi:hypothetical protein P3T76_005963 [Phytophthora citrophthora]|uniref:Uncharacterized protein n=1 Tax=Phytophthora citrophthora TaxID=4793 RepID=A0AAD9GPB7_9STRA|nr:hypothetical protein P3T76_005963 [Phytophthora citrophthora]
MLFVFMKPTCVNSVYLFGRDLDVLRLPQGQSVSEWTERRILNLIGLGWVYRGDLVGKRWVYVADNSLSHYEYDYHVRHVCINPFRSVDLSFQMINLTGSVKWSLLKR